MQTPPLVTTSPAGTGRAQAGVLGEDGTSALFGGGRLLEEIRSGGRFTLGCWLDPCQQTALELSYLFIGTTADGFFASSSGTPILARPFFNSQSGAEDSRLIAYPNVSTGAIDVYANNRFQGAEAILRGVLLRDGNDRLDLLAGYRFSDLNELFRTHEFTIAMDPAGLVPVGTTTSTLDRFDARNEFHGGEVGVSGHMQRCRWSMDLLMKLALGNTHSRMVLDGSTTVTEPTQTPMTSDSGFLVLGTNRGAYSRDQFTVIPELGLDLGFDLTPRLRASIGYSFIYWSRVARPGDQVAHELNPSQFPPGQLTGTPQPRFPFVVSDYWVQGINFGLALTY